MIVSVSSPLLNSSSRLVASSSPNWRISNNSGVSYGNDTLSLVRKLVKALSEFENIERVRAIALDVPDLHWLEFEAEMEAATSFNEVIRDAMRDLTIKAEWQLRDETHQDWYFKLSLVDQFSVLGKQVKVVSESYSSPSPFQLHETSSFTTFKLAG